MSLITDAARATHATPIVVVKNENYEDYLAKVDARQKSWLLATDFRAKPHTFAIVPNGEGKISQVVVGVVDTNHVHALSNLPLSLPTGDYVVSPLHDTVDLYFAALSWGLGAYQFKRYKTSGRISATLIVPSDDKLERAGKFLDAITLVRDLVNTPTEDMGPQHLANIARELAAEFNGSFHEWVGDELLTENFPAIHAVGRASHRPPRLIEIKWGQENHPRVAIVGKGVCFDTGGLDIKGAEGMRHMKKDMGGGAHALGVARLIMALELPVRLHMLIPAVENAISGNAYRPGEVVNTRKGIKIEIGNTDAEGRVVLSDALALACESNPRVVIDFATLTGAARVALGPELPALFANNDEWAAALLASSAKAQDPMWRMPLWQNYNEMIKSNIADIVNTGGPQAGAVTAALFLEHFVPREQAWLHLDLFAWNPKARPGRPEGGEAQSLRAVVEMLEAKFA